MLQLPQLLTARWPFAMDAPAPRRFGATCHSPRQVLSLQQALSLAYPARRTRSRSLLTARAFSSYHPRPWSRSHYAVELMYTLLATISNSGLSDSMNVISKNTPTAPAQLSVSPYVPTTRRSWLIERDASNCHPRPSKRFPFMVVLTYALPAIMSNSGPS